MRRLVMNIESLPAMAFRSAADLLPYEECTLQISSAD